jgi:hypothetical protein
MPFARSYHGGIVPEASELDEEFLLLTGAGVLE